MKTRRFLALGAFLLAVPLLPVFAQEDDLDDYTEEDTVATEAPAPKSAPAKAAAAQYAGYSVQSVFGKVEYQRDGTSAWQVLEGKSRPKLGDRDILKTGERSNVIFSAPGKCVMRLESSSTLMLDGASKKPAAMSLVKGTLLSRCAPEQEVAIKNSLFSAQASGASVGVSYDYDTAMAAAAKYDVGPATDGIADGAGKPPSTGQLKVVLPPGEDGKTPPAAVLEDKRQLTVSKQTRELQPVEIQSFFSDYTEKVTALSVPAIVKPKPKAAPQKVQVTKKLPVPKLEVSGFETKRQQERASSEDKSSFKDKYKKTIKE